MARLLSLLIIIANTFAVGHCLICYSLPAASNTTIPCSLSTCYSHSAYSWHYAGCGICSKKFYRDCLMCNTNYCNSLFSSSISCYSRSSASATGGNGLLMSCATGVSQCYSETKNNFPTPIYSGGCGDCTTEDVNGPSSCQSCNSTGCNTMTSSSMKCIYRRPISSVDGTVETIETEVECRGSTCYSLSHIYYSGYKFAGCGACSRTRLTPDCVTCSTENCNTLTPSNITCYTRTSSSPASNGTLEGCFTGVNSCYSTGNSEGGNSGCGSCTTNDSNSCFVCNTSGCNSMTPSQISCYNHTGASNQMVNCATGITSCFSYTVGSLIFGGCGVCSPANSPYGCNTCSTSYCNSNGVAGAVAATTVASASVTGNSGNSGNPGTTAAVKCYNRSAAPIGSNGAMVTCSSGVATCYSYVSDSKSYAGCGICNTLTDPYCAICSTDYCNSVSFSCYVRATLLTRGDGTVTSCASGVSSCFSFTSGSVNHAGCGTCSSAAADAECTACSRNLCNSRTAAINCYSSFGDSAYSARQKTSCSSGSCHQYSYGSGLYQFFFAGCGDCPANVKHSNCRTCYTEFCNPASAAAISQRMLGTAVLLTLGALL